MENQKELSPVNEEFFGFMDETIPKLDRIDQAIILGFAMGLVSKSGHSQEMLPAQKEKAPA